MRSIRDRRNPVARELVLEAKVESVEAEAALARLANAFTAAGDKADVAAEKAEKFEKSYRDGQARKAAKAELDALSGATAKAGDAATTAATKVGAKDRALSALTSTVMKFVAPVAIGAAIKSTLDWAGSLSDLSKTTGISTTSLQKFEIIGKSSGATMSEIANAAVSLSDKLAGGDKSAAQAIGRVGLSLGQLTSMSPDKALLEVAHAAAQIANPMERVAFLTDAVGKAGAKTLLPMLDDLEAKWNTVGGVINDKGIQALDDVGDAFGEVGMLGKQFLAEVLIPLAPGFTELTRSVLGFVSDTIPKLQAWFNGVIEGFMRVEVAFREFDDNMRNAGLRELDRMDPARAGAMRQLAGLPAGGFHNSAQTSKDRLGAFQFAGSEAAGGNLGQGMFGPAFFQPANIPGKALTDAQKRKAEAEALASWFTKMRLRTDAMYGSGAMAAPTPNGWTIPMADFGFGNAHAGLDSNLMTRSILGIGFDGKSVMNPFSTAKMVSPTQAMYGAAGKSGIGGFLSKNKGQLALLAGGLAAQFLPGRAGQVAQGAMGMAGQGAGLGAMFGPHGAAIGAGIGALVGGVSSLFGGRGRAEKNAKNAEISQVFEQFSSKQFLDLQKQAEKFGLSMDKALNAKTMKDFGAAVDEVNEKLQEMNDIQSQIDSLIEQTTVDFDKMNRVVQEFGLDISKLGPAFQQAAIDKEAQRIIDAMAIMEKGGADMSGVLEGMADEISKVVQDSIKFGTTIPENMKPWIEELMKSGKLVDENGQAITDMAKIKFGAAMESDMSKLTKKLDELIQKLAEMADAFNNVRDAAAGAGNVDVGGPSGNPNGGGQSQNGSGSDGFATGGMAGRDFRRPGHGDIFPALLRRGETVLPPGVGRAGGSDSEMRDILRAMRDKGDGNAAVTFVMIPSSTNIKDVEDRIWQQMPRQVAGNGPLRLKLRKALVTQGAA